MTYHMRWMIRRDMSEVLQCDINGMLWHEEDFFHWLRQRNCIGQVVELGERVIGFVIYTLEKHGLQIINMATHPDLDEPEAMIVYQIMINKMISKLHTTRTKVVVQIELRSARVPLLQLLTKMGFVAKMEEDNVITVTFSSGKPEVKSKNVGVPPD